MCIQSIRSTAFVAGLNIIAGYVAHRFDAIYWVGECRSNNVDGFVVELSHSLELGLVIIARNVTIRSGLGSTGTEMKESHKRERLAWTESHLGSVTDSCG